MPIPVIDVSALHSGNTDAIDELAREFYRVYSTAGFGYIVNHAVPETLVQRVFAASARFHALPLAEKLNRPMSIPHLQMLCIRISPRVSW